MTTNNIYSANGYIGYPTSVDGYHMTWIDIKSMMPEKAKVLNEYWKLIDKYPYRNSVPVFDVQAKEIYTGTNLNVEWDDPNILVTTINMATRRSIDKNLPWKCKYKLPVVGHMFMACEEVPIEILKDAVEQKRIEISRVREKEDAEAKELATKYINALIGLNHAIDDAKKFLSELDK